MGHRGWVPSGLACGVVLLALSPAHATAAAGSTGPQEATARATIAKKASPVVRPHPGQRVRRYPMRIVVRAGDRLFSLRVKLNGHLISRDFGRTRKGKRRANVSMSHGLRRGRNVLRVWVKRRDGTVRKQRLRFFVAQKRPLAGAGRDRRVAVGVSIKHRGRARPSPGKAPRRVRRHRLRYRWKLLRAPRRSSYRKHAGPALSNPTTRRPRFKPDVLGRYVFKLKVGNRRGWSGDRVVIDAAPKQWLVPVDTMAMGGEVNDVGIRVGSEFYPGFTFGDRTAPNVVGCEDAPPGDCLPWMQMVVLDRRTLGSPSNIIYACDRAAIVCPFEEVQAALAKLNDTKLVIASSQPNYALPIALWTQALGRIGAPSLNDAHTRPPGLLSVVGVPGLKPGQADVKFASGSEQVGEGMVGYLTPDQYLHFGWAPGDRVSFDTRAVVDSAAPGGLQNVVEVGEQRLEQTLPGSAQGGFGVAVLDRFSLSVKAQRSFEVSDHASAGANGEEMLAMAHFLSSTVGPGDLAVISSIGHSSVHAGPWAEVLGWSELAGVVESLGGTRHVFNSSLLRGMPYSLVGWGGAGATQGEEASPVILSRLSDARIRGALSTDRQSQFKPRGASPFSDPNDALVNEVLKTPTTKWPLADHPGTRAALSYLGSLDNKLGPDPRTAYVDDLDWGPLIGVIRAAKYPGSRKFSKADFNAAQKRLITEMRWVANVRQYLGNLSQPFDGENLPSWAQLKKTAQSIQNAANVKPNQQAESLLLDILGGVLEVTAIAIPESAAVAAVVVEVIAVTYGTALEYWTQNQDGSSGDVITDQATNLGADLENRFMETMSTFANMGNVIVTDPAKLQTVGSLGNCNPDENPRCPNEWAWTPAAKSQASTSLLLGLERSFYASLFPLAFPAYALQPQATNSNDSDDPSVDFSDPPAIGQFHCGDAGRRWPFADEPASGGTSVLQLDYIKANFGDANFVYTYFYYALASPKISFTSPVPAKPPAKLTQRMFAPIDPGGDPNAGGLGIYPPYFMFNANVRNYGPKDPFKSNCDWLPG